MLDENGRNFCKQVENTLGNGEIARYEKAGEIARLKRLGLTKLFMSNVYKRFEKTDTIYS